MATKLFWAFVSSMAFRYPTIVCMRIQILRFAQDDIIKRTSEKMDWAIRMVLETEPKVHSRAINEMREEVKRMITEQEKSKSMQ